MPSASDRPVSEVLERALRRLVESGWCQFDLALTQETGSPPQLCLDAALLYGIGITVPVTSRMRVRQAGSPDESKHPLGEVWRRQSGYGANVGDVIHQRLSPKLRRRYIEAVRYLCQVTGAEDLAAWNDDEFRTVDEVLDALRRARDLALANELQ